MEIRKAIVTVAIVLGIIMAVLVFGIPYLLALLVGLLVFILSDEKTYTKNRLLIYGSIILLLGTGGYTVLRDNPEYVMKHLKNNPKTTSLYVAQNGEEVISYQADVVRPLASTVKILIATEYAMQIERGRLNKESVVSLDDLKHHYFERTDGGAHEAWLESMTNEGKIKNNKVKLHDVAKGMIVYSSNANTDYLINLLGTASINERAKALGLTQHEEVYPIVGALFIPSHIKTGGMNDKQLVQALKKLPMETYHSLAEELSNALKEGALDFGDAAADLSMDVQKIWSDRLIGATANDYGKLMASISNDELPLVATEVLRDLLEWPMEMNESNQDRFTHLGMKGGSTSFVLTQALYAETLEGDKTEIVLLTDNLSPREVKLMQRNLNSFVSKLIGDEEFRHSVQQQLLEE
ncbi:serine hydrolase [Sporosarcina sp. YIM B06819]|uniref:serine hydrolase n=1 Tax=Sporosarcina sp. YIM B06819 TaxID=3081769 RepID=UPI00298BE9D4|nr:serine hydrolase [Sporosarcina sp. YIM B06819]